MTFDVETDVINKYTACLRYREHEPSSEPLNTTEEYQTTNVTCSTAVKLDTKMTRQIHSDSSRGEMLRKSAKYTRFDHKINQNYASDRSFF